MIVGYVRFIGDIDKRVNEDFLRIIRFYRFSIYYADTLNSKTIKILEKYHKNLNFLSFERKFDEIRKILNFENLHQKLIKESVVKELKKLFEKAFDIKLNFNNFEKFCELEYKLDSIDYERRLKYLMRNSKDRTNFSNRVNKKFRKRLCSKIIKFSLDENSLNKLLYKHDKSFVEDNILIQSAEKKIAYDEILKAKLLIKNYKKKIST